MEFNNINPESLGKNEAYVINPAPSYNTVNAPAKNPNSTKSLFFTEKDAVESDKQDPIKEFYGKIEGDPLTRMVKRVEGIIEF